MDKKTIGLTAENKRKLPILNEEEFFKSDLDLAKFAMAYAMGKNLENEDLTAKTETTWNVGSFDSDGEIKRLVSHLYPEVEEPYKFVERMFNVGLQKLVELKENDSNFEIVDLVIKPEDLP